MHYLPSNSWMLFLIFHVLVGLALWKMAERKKVGPDWFAWVPVLNVLLMLRLAGKPDWWLLLMFVPLVNIVVLIMVMMTLCEKFGVSKWAGLLAIISPLNLALLLYLAFGAKNGAQRSL